MGSHLDEGDDSAGVPRRWLGILAGAVLALIIGFIAYEARMNALVNARITKAHDQTVTWMNRLSADKDDKGHWKQWPSETLPDTDPWGNPLRVSYERDKNTVRLTVSSDGPDRTQWSPDDIHSGHSRTDWIGAAKDGAEVVEEVAGATTRGLVGGAIEGVTDHIPKQLRDKMGIPGKGDRKKEEEKK